MAVLDIHILNLFLYPQMMVESRSALFVWSYCVSVWFQQLNRFAQSCRYSAISHNVMLVHWPLMGNGCSVLTHPCASVQYQMFVVHP